VADAIAALPAGILVAMGIATLLAGRAWKSDRLCALLCGAAFALAGGTVGREQFLTRDSPSLGSPQTQTVVAAQASDPLRIAAIRRFFIHDRLGRSATWLALGLGLMAALAASDGQSSRRDLRFAILLLSLAGVLLAAIANDLYLSLLAIEVAALPTTVLLFVEPGNATARTEAARSLALNLLALAMLVGGAVLVGLFFGTTNLDDLRAALPQPATSRHVRTLAVTSPIAGQIGLVLLFAGLGVHFLAAPFQLATAEIFDGAKFWAIGLTAIFPRAAALLLMIRIFVNGAPRLYGTAQTLFTAIGFLTILLGSVLAVGQSRIRRLLAFLVVFQSGLILVALAAGCSERGRAAATPWVGMEVPGGVGAACLCFAFDSLAIVGLLAIVASRGQSNRSLDEIDQVADAVRSNSLTAAALCVLATSLAGIPPFAGFWSRLAILRSVLSISVPAEHGFLPHQNVDYVVVAIAAAGGLILLAVVTLGFVKKVLFDDLDTSRVEILTNDRQVRMHTFEKTGVAIGMLAALAIVVLGISPGPITRIAARETADEHAISQVSTDPTLSLPESGNAVKRRGHAVDDADL
jgi:NADH:ubiquinone oxidoreductase subunit 2 (subunit N)